MSLARLPALRVAIDEQVGPSGHVVGTASAPTSDRCRVRMSLRVREGRALAGDIVLATGRFRATDRGLRGDASIAGTGKIEMLRAWRGRTGETIDRLFGTNAALVRALLIADQDGIAPDVRDRFADAGLVHMLSISGLHVAIITSALLTLATATRAPRNVATVVALAFVVLYVVTLGAPAPAVRSAVMLATVSLSERMQRPVHPWTALALGAVVPTIDPGVVLDLGYQLSVSGMAALVAARSVLRRVRPSLPAWSGWRWQLVRELATGVIATAVTAPLIAWTFGRVSVVAPVSNLFAGPIVAFVQPALFLALLLQQWPALAGFVAAATSAPLALLDRVASVSAGIPYASLRIAPTLAGALCAGVATATFVRATASRRMIPGLLLAAGALTLSVWLPLLPTASGVMELHMLDVGQGDALAVRTPRGRWIVVDAGRRWEGGDAGRRTVVPYIQRRGGDIAAFVMSHAHDDHVGGAASVVAALHPQRWWEPAFVTSSSAYRQALAAVAEGSVRWERAHPGLSLRLDGVRLRVLAPDSAWTAGQNDANETSVVLRVEYRDVAFLLTGDAEEAEERWLLAHTDAALLRADVLKLGHHGSRTSSSAAFVAAVQPRLGLISVGADNSYGHPSPETLLTFARRGTPVLRTDREGTIVVDTDGHRVHVSSGGHRWILDGQ